MNKPQNALFVVGLERSGTHTMCEVMKKACRNRLPSLHEQPPYLCREAYFKFNHLKMGDNQLEEKLKQLHSTPIVCECNHRFGFFVHEICRALPASRFLLLLREPVDIIRSRIMNMAFVDDVIHLLPPALAAEMLEQPQHDYNRFRIKPRHGNFTKAYQYYLYDLVETVRFTLSQLRKLPRDRFQIHHVSRLHERFVAVLHMLDQAYDWDYDAAFKQSLVKSDSAMEDPRRAANFAQASDLVEPYRQEIETAFLLACTGLGMSESHLPEFLAEPEKMMGRTL